VLIASPSGHWRQVAGSEADAVYGLKFEPVACGTRALHAQLRLDFFAVSHRMLCAGRNGGVWALHRETRMAAANKPVFAHL
jgi:hypothetical protein